MKFYKQQLAYQVFGDGQPIYFLHGMSLSGISMSGVYEKIVAQSQFRRYYVDLPGMGASQNVSGIQSADDVADLLAAFIQETAGDAPVIIVGHSYGGYLAFILAQRLSNVVGIFNTCPVVIAASDQRHVAQHVTKVVDAVPNDGSAAMKGYYFMNVIISLKTWAAYQHQVVPGQQQFNSQFWDSIRQNGHYAISNEAQLFDQLAERMIPIYVLLGRHDNIVGYEDHLAKLKRLPNSHVVIDDNAGHSLLIDDPKLVDQQWQQFMRAVAI
ncbi:alpha/beta fold hydrolase [Secundilactobacillus hailunensis]|uniref:Alpha/beta fold hydrolase n=1 Tax=Secundilactobacillus hailunensis TaxID=2559923 RepID=A0ABW1T5Q1_9LACO|nr:alpha/beta hydrolase [Secundilactobacillus hailunensis]